VSVLVWSTAVALLLLAVAAAVATRVPALDRPVRLATYGAEALVVLVAVIDTGLVLRADPADRPDSTLTHVGYAVVAAGLLPLLVWRRPLEEDAEPEPDPEPVSLWVVVVALLAVAACLVRLAQTR
jgi:hypothetical protein